MTAKKKLTFILVLVLCISTAIQCSSSTGNKTVQMESTRETVSSPPHENKVNTNLRMVKRSAPEKWNIALTLPRSG